MGRYPYQTLDTIDIPEFLKKGMDTYKNIDCFNTPQPAILSILVSDDKLDLKRRKYYKGVQIKVIHFQFVVL